MANIAAVMDRNPDVVVEAVGVGAQMHSLVALGGDGTVTGRPVRHLERQALHRAGATIS